MARYAVVALLLLALLSSEAAVRPKESNKPGDEVREATCDDNLVDKDTRRIDIVSQCDAGLFYYWTTYLRSPQGSATKAEARKLLLQDMSHTMLMEDSMTLIGKLLFGTEKGPEVLKTRRPADLPYVDDWNCFHSLVKIFTMHCGSLDCATNGWKSIANICNAGIKEEQMAWAAAQACPRGPSKTWNAT